MDHMDVTVPTSQNIADRLTDKLQNSTSSQRHHITRALTPTMPVDVQVQLRRRPNVSSTPTPFMESPSFHIVARPDVVAVEQLRQVRNDAIALRNESFYSAAAIVTIAGIFVALTVTASLALFVFWRKTNTVFVLQKCEQQDYADEDDDDSNDVNIEDDDDNESRITESDSDGAVPEIIVNKRKSSRRKMKSSSKANRWLLVDSEDCDDISRTSAKSRTGRCTHRQSKHDRAQRHLTADNVNILTSVAADDVITMTTMKSSNTDNVALQCVEMHDDRTKRAVASVAAVESSPIDVTETRLSFHQV